MAGEISLEFCILCCNAWGDPVEKSMACGAAAALFWQGGVGWVRWGEVGSGGKWSGVGVEVDEAGCTDARTHARTHTPMHTRAHGRMHTDGWLAHRWPGQHACMHDTPLEHPWPPCPPAPSPHFRMPALDSCRFTAPSRIPLPPGPTQSRIDSCRFMQPSRVGERKRQLTRM